MTWDAAAATLHGDGTTLRARHVVLAIAPALVRTIAFTPALPAERDQLLQRMPMGATIKCLAVYERPFWRAAGFSGEVVSDSGLISVTYDNTSHDGGHAALVAFIVGAAARQWSARGEAARRAAVLAALADWFGPQAAEPIFYEDKDWSADPWSAGCPVGVFPPGALTSAATTLRTPVGCLHFAGTETAVEWTGYMEGAVEVGRARRGGDPAINELITGVDPSTAGRAPLVAVLRQARTRGGVPFALSLSKGADGAAPSSRARRSRGAMFDRLSTDAGVPVRPELVEGRRQAAPFRRCSHPAVDRARADLLATCAWTCRASRPCCSISATPFTISTTSSSPG